VLGAGFDCGRGGCGPGACELVTQAPEHGDVFEGAGDRAIGRLAPVVGPGYLGGLGECVGEGGVVEGETTFGA
jgi:hypothetical protein